MWPWPCRYTIIVIAVLLTVVASKKPLKNACPTFQDYSTIAKNPKCFYDPDMALDTEELIVKYAGNVERYSISTEDGYILTIFRIPPPKGVKKAKGVILLEHPLSLDGRAWVGQGNSSLWRSGYDIWIGNHRGTKFSKKHLTMKSSDVEFWNYTFHEIGKYDIDTDVNFVRQHTQSEHDKIIYVAHSMGATSGLIYASLRPDKAKMAIRTFIFVDTACYFNHTWSAAIAFNGTNALFEEISRNLKLGPVLPQKFLKTVVAPLIRGFPTLLYFIYVGFNAALGWTLEEGDPKLFNLDAIFVLRNFSWKLIRHYIQLIQSRDKFHHFDYDKDGNLLTYGNDTVPLYPLERISVPIYLISSRNDSLTTSEDSQILFNRLPPVARVRHLVVTGANHGDPFLGKNRQRIIWDPVMNYIESLK